MKRSWFIFLTLLMSVKVFSQSAEPQWTAVAGNTPAPMKVELISSTEQSIVVHVTVPGFYATDVITPQGQAAVITVPKLYNTAQAGEPNMPMLRIPALIDSQARMAIRVKGAKYMDFEGIDIAPSKGDFPRSIDPATVPYTYGECYRKDAFFPAVTTTLDDPYIVRDCRGQNIALHPFVYNAVKKTLRVYYDVTVEMYKVDDKGRNPMKARKRGVQTVSRDFRDIYQRHFINYQVSQSRYNVLDDDGDLLIICPDKFVDAMQPLVDWKTVRGLKTTMVSLSEVGGNDHEKIKEYISKRYYDPQENLTFVLLVGDYDDITPCPVGREKGDNPFGQVEGDDIYNDVIIGRFSANNVAEVETQVNRVIYYERDITSEATWLQKGLGIGANEGAGSGHHGESDYQHIEYIRDTLMHYGYEPVYQQYSGVGGGTSANAISGDINSGVGIINYCNHGSETSWAVAGYSNTNVNALVNDNMLPFVFSVACLNGKFNYGSECFAEAWMHAKNDATGVPTGAIGTYMSFISQPWQPPMYAQDEFVNIITENTATNLKHTIGGAVINASMSMLDYCPNDNGNTYQTWILFGDPSMMLRTKTPQKIDVTHNGVINVRSQEYTILADDAEGAVATINYEGEILGQATITDGMATIELGELPGAGESITLNVFGYNKVFYYADILVTSDGAYLAVGDNAPVIAPAGTDEEINLTFKNVGTEDIDGTTTITLSSDDERVSITEGTATIDPLGIEEKAKVPFTIHIADSVEDDTKLRLHYTATCGDKTWDGYYRLTAQNAKLEYQYMVSDGELVAGGEIPLRVSFRNAGHYRAANAQITATTTSEYATISEPTVRVDTLDVDQDVLAEFFVAFKDSMPDSEKIPMTFTMTADGGISAQGTETLKNVCNVQFLLRDSYGDGWNGGKLIVSFDDGTPSQELTIAIGSDATYTIEIAKNTEVTLTWVAGRYDSECSFTVQYEDGGTIYECSNPASGELFTFVCGVPMATFCYVAVTANNPRHGTVSGGGMFRPGQTCTVTAMPLPGYSFIRWTLDGKRFSTDETVSFPVNNFMELVAEFSEEDIAKDNILLAEQATDNSAVIRANSDKTVCTTLDGRTLHTDDCWNAICLPFTLGTLKGSPLNGFTVMQLDTDATGYQQPTGIANGTLYLNFKPATSIQAGVPYIVRRLYTTPGDRSIPVYSATGGTIDSTMPELTFDNLVDGDSKTCWRSPIADGKAYCLFNAPKPVEVSAYAITTSNMKTDTDPRVWTLKAKLHPEDPWTVIDSRNAMEQPLDLLPGERNAPKTFYIASDLRGAYQYFLFEVTATESQFMSLAELTIQGYYAGQPVDIHNPIFYNVNLDGEEPVTKAVTFDGGSFVGNYDYAPCDKNRTILLFGDNNTLYCPLVDINNGIALYLEAFQSHFELDPATPISAVSLNFGQHNTETAIVNVNGNGVRHDMPNAYYTLDGRKLQGKPTQKGVYIYKGKKQVIK